MENKNIFRLLQIATIALLLGRGWQFMVKGNMFNDFLGHPTFMNPVVKYIYQTDWKEYLTNPAWGDFHGNIVFGIGVYFLLSILMVVFIKKIPPLFIKTNLWIISFILFFLAFSLFIGKGFQVGQWIEYSLQFCTPIFLLYYFLSKNISKKYILFIKIATAFTFIGHGLYAIGYYPRPGNFVDMMIKGFGTTQSQSEILLDIVGYLDLIAAGLLFLPIKKIYKAALIYIIIWGFLTTLARVYANFSPGLGWYSLKQWLPEMLMRFPHFLIPAVLFFIQKKTTIP